MQLPDEYQNDSQGRDKWHRSHNNNKEEENKNYEEEAKQLLEKIFSVNSYFYHSCSLNLWEILFFQALYCPSLWIQG